MSGQWRIWNADDAADRRAWVRLWEQSPMQHPFAHPDLCWLLRPHHGRLMAATMTVGSGHILYPFFLRDIDDAGPLRQDIISPYGYGGPLHWGLDSVEESAAQFWARFGGWADESGVVSEFVRFSLFGDELLPYPGPTRERQTNYVRDLDVPEEELWLGVESKVRSNVRRARKEGVRVVVDTRGEHLQDFLRIYHGTMERRDSAAWYRFDADFFSGLHAALPGRYAYVMAEHEGRIVSADLLLLSADSGYYFLGGTDRDSFSARPNDLVKFEAMSWLRHSGRSSYVLGGGVQPKDGLERYKRGFAPRGAVPFTTGERVFAPKAYESLVNSAKQQFATAGVVWEEADGFFPEYRRQVPADRLPSRLATTEV
jgi:hypothetical protein